LSDNLKSSWSPLHIPQVFVLRDALLSLTGLNHESPLYDGLAVHFMAEALSYEQAY